MRLSNHRYFLVMCVIASSGCESRSTASASSRNDPVPTAVGSRDDIKPAVKSPTEQEPTPKPVFDPDKFEVKEITSIEQFTKKYNVFGMLYLGSDKTSHVLIHRFSDTVWVIDRTLLPDRQLVAQYEDKKKNRDPLDFQKARPNRKRSEKFLKWYYETKTKLTRVPGISEDDDW
jgi:hypothetical protein